MTTTTGKQKLLPYDIARSHLIETGWRGLAGWNRDAKLTEQQRRDSVLDLYAKNGRILLLGASAGGGFEIYFPSPTMDTKKILAEIDAYGDIGIRGLHICWAEAAAEGK